jgi:uncharacterized protein (TIGR03083 family)
VTGPTISSMYLFAHESFAALARTLTADDWAAPTPCTPGWTVRDVLSHVAGVSDDALAGRMDGAPGEAWTASQVERHRDRSVDGLLGQWAAQAPAFAEALDAMEEARPPFDCHSHEHDVRHAIGRPGNRSNVIVERAGFGLASIGDVGVRVVLELDDGRVVESGDPASTDTVRLRGIGTFELFRSRLGRRSRSQVREYDWSGADDSIDAVVDRWFRFGPATDPIIE